MKTVRVIIKAGFASTPDTKEEFEVSELIQFTDEEAEKLVDGFCVQYLSQEDLKNECDLNSLENQIHE